MSNLHTNLVGRRVRVLDEPHMYGNPHVPDWAPGCHGEIVAAFPNEEGDPVFLVECWRIVSDPTYAEWFARFGDDRPTAKLYDTMFRLQARG